MSFHVWCTCLSTGVHVFLCVYAHVFPCVCPCLSVWSQRETFGAGSCFPPCLRQEPPFVSLYSRLIGPVSFWSVSCFFLPPCWRSARVTGAWCHAWLLCGLWGFQLSSSWLASKCFNKRWPNTISPTSMHFLFPKRKCSEKHHFKCKIHCFDDSEQRKFHKLMDFILSVLHFWKKVSVKLH